MSRGSIAPADWVVAGNRCGTDGRRRDAGGGCVAKKSSSRRRWLLAQSPSRIVATTQKAFRATEHTEDTETAEELLILFLRVSVFSVAPVLAKPHVTQNPTADPSIVDATPGRRLARVARRRASARRRRGHRPDHRRRRAALHQSRSAAAAPPTRPRPIPASAGRFGTCWSSCASTSSPRCTTSCTGCSGKSSRSRRS